jgi:hypothetical protein
MFGREADRKGERRPRVAAVSLLLIAGVMTSTAMLPAAAGPTKGAHLWLQIVPGTYVFDHPDPWLLDSWVDPLNYTANATYYANLTVTNRGAYLADIYLLTAIPNTTTTDMFSTLRLSGGAGGSVTYDAADFDRTDYNPYYHEASIADAPIVDPIRQYQSGSHGVYPPSGNANWTTYHVGNVSAKGSATVAIVLTLGPGPDDAFKVHFDAYSVTWSLIGSQLQYWTPPSHDATMASENLLSDIPAIAVDVSGDNDYVAVGWGRNVTFFDTYADQDARLLWTNDTGHEVINVVLSENGSYLAVTSNEVPFNGTTHSYLSLYRTSTGERILHQELDHNVLRSTRPLDISRNGSYIAVGTAGWASGQTACRDENGAPARGTVYLIENPDLVQNAGFSTYNRTVNSQSDCVMAVRFSGNGEHLIAGFFWFYGADVLSAPSLNLEATTGNIGSDPVYSVAISYNGHNITTGQGFLRRVSLWDFTPGDSTLNLLWRTASTTTNGSHHQQVISDDGEVIFTKQEDDNQANGGPAFHLFNSTIPGDPADKQSEWTYAASYFYPAGVGLSVANSTYGIGADGTQVYLWGNGSGSPPSGTPVYTFVANDTTTDAAISYSGPIFAVTDNNGYLYVFKADQSGDKVYWTWHT